MGIVTSFYNAYGLALRFGTTDNRWNRTIEIWSEMTDDQRLEGLNLIGRGRVNARFLLTLRERGFSIENYKRYSNAPIR